VKSENELLFLSFTHVLQKNGIFSIFEILTDREDIRTGVIFLIYKHRMGVISYIAMRLFIF
jgi:hypothetical protein